MRAAVRRECVCGHGAVALIVLTVVSVSRTSRHIGIGSWQEVTGGRSDAGSRLGCCCVLCGSIELQLEAGCVSPRRSSDQQVAQPRTWCFLTLHGRESERQFLDPCQCQVSAAAIPAGRRWNVASGLPAVRNVAGVRCALMSSSRVGYSHNAVYGHLVFLSVRQPSVYWASPFFGRLRGAVFSTRFWSQKWVQFSYQKMAPFVCQMKGRGPKTWPFSDPRNGVSKFVSKCVCPRSVACHGHV